MRRNGIVIIAAVAVLGILTALYLMRDPDYNWYRMYGIDDTEPFGLRYFKEVLEESNGIHEVNIHDDSFNFLMQEAGEDEEEAGGRTCTHPCRLPQVPLISETFSRR